MDLSHQRNLVNVSLIFVTWKIWSICDNSTVTSEEDGPDVLAAIVKNSTVYATRTMFVLQKASNSNITGWVTWPFWPWNCSVPLFGVMLALDLTLKKFLQVSMWQSYPQVLVTDLYTIKCWFNVVLNPCTIVLHHYLSWLAPQAGT